MMLRLRRARTEATASEKDEKGVEQFILTINELQECRSGEREIHYRGALLDIVRIEHLPDGKVAVTARHDATEQEIMRLLGLHLKPRRETNREASLFVQLLTQVYLLPDRLEWVDMASVHKKMLPCSLQTLYSTFRPAIPSPPPQLAA